MSTLFLTSIIAFVLIILAIAALALGWLISGKSKIVRGCSKNIPKERAEECDSAGDTSSCSVCNSKEKVKKKKK